VVIPASSTEYIHIPVTTADGTDLSGSPPRIALLPASTTGNPTDADWHDAAWETATTARLLIGPDGGDITLAPGDYSVWITFDPPGPEDIVRLAGWLTIK
jgi:hypothetical protein